MPGTWDANIKLVYAADSGSAFAVDTVSVGQGFDVIADTEIGAQLNGVVVRHDLFVSVRNLSQAGAKAILNDQTFGAVLAPAGTPRNDHLVVTIPAVTAGQANEGDVLEVVATYKVSAGINTDYSSKKSETFVVSV